MNAPADYWRILRAGGFRRLRDEIVENLWFDLRRGTDTQTRLPTNGANYVPSYASIVSAALQQVAPRIDARSAVFFDFGCGKGKALILAVESRSFRQVAGIEADPRLADIAVRNLRLCGYSQDTVVRVMDGSEFTDFPPVCVLYLYNPFSAETLSRVLSNVEAARVRHGIIVYLDPVHERLLGGWKCIHRQDWPGDSRRQLAIFERRSWVS